MLTFDEIRNELETLDETINAVYEENDMSKIEYHENQINNANNKAFQISEFIENAKEFKLIDYAEAEKAHELADDYMKKTCEVTEYIRGLKKARSVYTKVLLANGVELG